MEQPLDIAEVARRTGVTSRALRFYEARGLIHPLRTAAGRRLFGRGDLERLNAILALKRAGFSLSAIDAILTGRHPDFQRLIDAQISEINARAAELADMRSLLTNIQSRIDRGEPIDVATLCSLIRKGNTMESDKWKRVTDRYFSAEEKADWADALQEMPDEFCQESYSASWRRLGARIEAALPLDPASDEAKAFVREWLELLAPFSRVATAQMWEGSKRLYADMPAWQHEADPGFSSAAYALIQEASTLMRANGEELGPLPAHLRK